MLRTIKKICAFDRHRLCTAMTCPYTLFFDGLKGIRLKESQEDV